MLVVTEVNACEDAVYHLEKALDGGHMELEAFLQVARRVTQRQFMAQALSMKIEQEQRRRRGGIRGL